MVAKMAPLWVLRSGADGTEGFAGGGTWTDGVQTGGLTVTATGGNVQLLTLSVKDEP